MLRCKTCLGCNAQEDGNYPENCELYVVDKELQDRELRRLIEANKRK